LNLGLQLYTELVLAGVFGVGFAAGAVGTVYGIFLLVKVRLFPVYHYLALNIGPFVTGKVNHR